MAKDFDFGMANGAMRDGSGASGTKSYHNGGVEGSSFADWYDKHLASYYGNDKDDPKGSGSGGTKGSGSGGTKGSGSGGTKGSGSGGTKGSGSGGTKGSGSGGTKGSGSGGTKGSGSGGTKGSGSGGTKGSGSGGTKGSGSGGTKGSGSGGTKGSGSGGTKGSGSGGTKGSGSGGTKGSGSGGTKGSGSGGTKGSGSGGGGNDPGDDKSTLNFKMGDPEEVNVSVSETPEGQLFFNITPSDFNDQVDIDGIFFNVAEDSPIRELNFYPDENTRDVTDIQSEPGGVSALPNGAGVGENFDVGLQFGTVPDSSEGTINTTNFTLWSGDGPMTLDDIDLSGMRLIVDSDETGGEVLGVSGSDDPDFTPDDVVPDSDIVLEDVMALMTQSVDENTTDSSDAGDGLDDLLII